MSSSRCSDGDTHAAQPLFADGLAARHARIHDLRAPRRCRPRRLAVHAPQRQARRRAWSSAYPVNLFSLDLRARKHLMIAGGIGITPFMAQTAQLAASRRQFRAALRLPHRLARHLCRRAAGSATAAASTSITTTAARRSSSTACSPSQPLGTHLYVCGPAGMIDWVRGTRRRRWAGRPRPCITSISPRRSPALPFDVTLAVSGKQIRVGEQQSLLEAIEAAGVDPPYLCRGGVCGQCETNVISLRRHVPAQRPLADATKSTARAGRSCPACRASRAARWCWNGRRD